MYTKNRSFPVMKLLRHGIQLVAFLLLPGLFVTTLSAAGDIVKALASGTFSLSALSGQIATVFAVLGVTALLGRFFCGYLCAFGTVQELLGAPMRRLRPKGFSLPKGVDRGLKWVKYAVLAFILGMWISGGALPTSLSPWGTFGMLVSGNGALAFSALSTPGFVLLIACLAGALFVPRFFCRYLCPLGAVFAAISKKRAYQIRCGEHCLHCGNCRNHCCMGLDPTRQEDLTSGECIACMECIPVCPCGSLSTAPAPALAGAGAATAIGALAVFGPALLPAAPAVSLSTPTGETTGGPYTDGVYQGTGTGFRGDVSVSVTVDGGAITDITVDSYQDDAQFFDRAKAGVIPAILSGQSLDVDAVSGATFSSNGIKEAVANALGASYENPNATLPGGHGGDSDRPGGASGHGGRRRRRR